MSRGFPWNRLGIDATSDTAAIRKAYAKVLRASNVDEDIAGYTELRRARDRALWLAAQSARGAEAENDLGLGGFDDDWGADDADDADDAWDDSPAAYHTDLAGPSRPVELAPELTESQRRAQTAWAVLLGVLYPDDAPSDEAVTLDELEAASSALGVLIARAEDADLAEHDALDDGLAELFARTWPRSAPFVEPANAAFGWLDEAGALEERPALRFLNQRLQGMRFHDKVQQPDHPLYKAWAELSRPGRAGMRDRLRVKRLEIADALGVVRNHFPELESHLDPERVASWEGAARIADPVDGGPGTGFTRILLVVFLVFGMLRVCSGTLFGTSDDSPPVAPLATEAGPSAAEIDADLAAVFGKGTDMASVRATDPVLADQLAPLASLGEKPGEAMLAFVRLKALTSANIANADNLAVRADLRSLWMQAAQRQSGEACRKVMRGDFADLDLGLTDAQRDRERALLTQLLDAKLLGAQIVDSAYRYNIPGWLVGDTIKRSGLSDDTLTAALTDPDHPDRCKAESALVEAVRAAPGKVPLDVLKGL